MNKDSSENKHTHTHTHETNERQETAMAKKSKENQAKVAKTLVNNPNTKKTKVLREYAPTSTISQPP